MDSIESLNIPIIEGTEITAGDVLSLARNEDHPIPEYPYEDLQRARAGMAPEQNDSIRSILDENEVNDGVRRRMWSLVCSMGQLARTAADRKAIERSFRAS